MRICVASVPHRADNVVRALPELRGRVLAIDVDYWSRRDLLAIPKLGFAHPQQLAIDDDSLVVFAAEAAGSPQLMQSICLWTCNHLGVHEPSIPARAVTLDAAARKQILFLTSCTVDFRSLVRALVAGPRTRPGERRTYTHRDGRTGDVYLTVMRAIALDPPRLELNLRRARRSARAGVQGRLAGWRERRAHVPRAVADRLDVRRADRPVARVGTKAISCSSCPIRICCSTCGGPSCSSAKPRPEKATPKTSAPRLCTS